MLSRRHVVLYASAWTLLTACGKRSPKAAALPANATVLALGDSLTQGVGTSAEHAWPTLLEQASPWEVINAGISGDTSAQALARLPGLLQEHAPDLVIVSIGGNDFLRQMDSRTTRQNIQRICQQAQASGAQVLLVAVPQFSLLGAKTGNLSDHPLYAELAKEMQLPLFERGWSDMLSDEKLRSDQVHGNAQGYAQFAQGLIGFMRQHGWLL